MREVLIIDDNRSSSILGDFLTDWAIPLSSLMLLTKVCKTLVNPRT